VGPALDALGAPPGAVTEADLRALIEARWAADGGGIVADLQRAGIAAYVARSPEGLIVDDQLASRRYFMRMDHPVIGDGFHMCLPWQEVARSRRAWYRRAPLLGEDDEWATRSWREPPDGPPDRVSVPSPVGADTASTV
jgi:crotonobetainyl-CoA:carnitine CoA-transferase CaiB-like acyl-CoA transferase